MPRRKTTRRKSTKRRTTRTRRYTRPVVLKVIRRQTRVRKSISRDRNRTAYAPGKRRSRTGKIYWETRKNRSDLPGKRI